MVTPVTTVKKTAKSVIKSNVSKFAIAALVPISVILCCMLLSEIFFFIEPLKVIQPFVYILFYLFIIIPAGMGTLRYYWRAYSGCDESCTAQFYYFADWKKYFRSLRVMFNIVIRFLFFGLIVFIPTISVNAFLNKNVQEYIGIGVEQYSEQLKLLSSVLSTIAIFVLIAIMIRYYLAPFLMIADEDMEIDEAIYISRLISQKSGGNYAVLLLSFVGWYFLTFLVVPAVFTIPYMVLSYLVHCDYVVIKYNRIIDAYTNYNAPVFVADF